MEDRAELYSEMKAVARGPGVERTGADGGGEGERGVADGIFLSNFSYFGGIMYVV